VKVKSSVSNFRFHQRNNLMRGTIVWSSWRRRRRQTSQWWDILELT
jgi:hypothetical protein